MKAPAARHQISTPPAGGSAAKAWVRALEMTAKIDAAPMRTLPVVIDELAARFGAAPALLSTGETFTYRQLAERARRYARWALAEGLRPGDAVALMMPNRPDYMAIWLGLTRVGVVVALLNTRLTGAALRHVVGAAEARLVVVSSKLAGVLKDALAGRARDTAVWVHGEAGPAEPRLDAAIEVLSADPLAPHETPEVRLSDRALLIYTSGTTGLPKAAHVSHHRMMMWSHWFAGMTGAGPQDRLYNCLPMHHSVGGVVATGSLLVAGGSVVIAERFSGSRFWDDIVRWDCTMVQYIGELCRYLLAAPPSPKEAEHSLRLVCGNGLSGEVWAPFKDRFRIPQILEFYAATEGNFSLYNAEGQPGAIGRIPPFLAHRFPAAIVKFDPQADAPTRGPDGRCIHCAPGEVGEAIGRISRDPNNLAARFEGYTSAADTEKKVLRDVFAAGDAWLRTGDLMRTDAKGFYYFVDRIGDTFRWKGENIATTEVAEAIRACPGVLAASVYGVMVPGTDGRAGMAALVTGEGFDLATLHAHLTQRLPAYARPLFLRLVEDLDATETFKPKKQDLMDQGFGPARIADPLYFADPRVGGYVPLNSALFGAIASGSVRL
jgi:fatty-acyl-CoA synthase